MISKRPLFLTLTGAAAFTLLTGARGCSSVETGYVYDEYGNLVPVPVVVDDGYPPGGAVYVDSPVPAGPVYVDLVGDFALTVYAPYDDGVSPFTQSFDITLREDGAYGPVVLQGRDYMFDASGAGAVDMTDLAYGLYDIEVIGYDAYGAQVSYAAATVTLEESVQYQNLQLQNSGVVAPTPVTPVVVTPVGTGDVVLDLSEPDGGVYAPATDTIDTYLWSWDAASGQYVFVESVGYIPWNPSDPPVIPGLAYGWYYLEVDAFDAGGVKNYTSAGEFEVNSGLTTVPVLLDYLQ